MQFNSKHTTLKKYFTPEISILGEKRGGGGWFGFAFFFFLVKKDGILI